jgi:DNA-directed RNA polymerase specialized sigma subunit
MDMDEQWKTWDSDRSKDNMNAMLQSANPIIDKAITSYAPGSSPAVRSQAKILTRRAIENFDPKKGMKLQSHLYTQLQPLQREAMSYETLYAPERVRFDLRNLRDQSNQFNIENGREPNDDELADFTSISKRRIAHLRRFDKMVLGEGRFTPEDDDENDASLPGTQQAGKIWQEAVYEDLGNIDKLIYDLRTGRNGREKALSVTDIGKKLKMSPSAVSQRLKRISDKISEGVDYE